MKLYLKIIMYTVTIFFNKAWFNKKQNTQKQNKTKQNTKTKQNIDSICCIYVLHRLQEYQMKELAKRFVRP